MKSLLSALFNRITRVFTAAAALLARMGRFMLTMEFNKIAAAVLFTLFTFVMARSVGEMIYGGGHHGPKKQECYYEEFCAGVAGEKKEEIPVDPMMLIATADPAKGEKVFANCKACHTREEGGKHGTGPNLWAILDAPKATKANFNYSDALKARGGVWDYENLYAFLLNPKKYDKGTAMNFAGLKKPEKTAAMVAYLRTLHPNPPALPDYTPPAPVEEVQADAAAQAAE